MTEGLVFTVEPFLSLGADYAESGEDDPWTLYSPRAARCRSRGSRGCAPACSRSSARRRRPPGRCPRAAEKDGYFSDTGASFAVPPVTRAVERLCRDGRRAWATSSLTLMQVAPGKP
jgi:methionine aminopeptidase